MKLNLREIKVLANKLSEELNKENGKRAEEAIKNYKPSAEYKALSKKLDKYIALEEELSSSYGIKTYHISKEDVLHRFILKECKINCDYIGSWTLENDIILAQIDCPSVEAIIEKVKSRYL